MFRFDLGQSEILPLFFKVSQLRNDIVEDIQGSSSVARAGVQWLMPIQIVGVKHMR